VARQEQQQENRATEQAEKDTLDNTIAAAHRADEESSFASMPREH